ncbi:photosystem I assembly protein Ycf3 [Marinibacterium anthonyi]|nr:photosystem I assembly protein Ycf3 [Marinibacterium anthonyi]
MKAEKSVTWQLSEAKAAARRGDRARAQALYEAILGKYPGNRKARAGLAGLGQAVVTDPDGRQMARLLGLYHNGLYAEALEGAQQVVADAPDHKEARNLIAACHRMMDAPEKALPIYRARLEEDPGDAGLWERCGSTLVAMLRLGEAAECLQMATRLAPDVTGNWLKLANCHQRRGDNPSAFQALTQALGRDPDHVAALDQLGQVLRDMDRTDMALAAHERALSLSREPADRSLIQANIGVILSSRGDREGARNRYLAALTERRGNVHALLNLVTLAFPEDTHTLARRAERLLEDGGLNLQDRSQLNFALFRLRDREGKDPARAYAHLQEGNALRRELIRYSVDNQTALFRTIRVMSDDAPVVREIPDGPRPVFIVGLPRSGTTLTEQMLSAAPDVHAAGELTMVERLSIDLLRRLEVENRRIPTAEDMRQFATELRAGLGAVSQGQPVVLDKMPLNFRWVGLILAALPDARVVHIRRDPVETCWSNFTTSFSSHGNGFAYGLDDLVHYHRLYSDLTDHWRGRFPDRFRTVPYEDLVARPDPVMRALVEWCGLDWSDGCLHPETVDRAVLTASVHQVRREIYNGNRGKWRPYAPFIGTLLDGLGSAHAA